MPNRPLLALLSLALLAVTLPAQVPDPVGRLPLLPDHVRDDRVPPPSAVLGYEAGDWHVRPEQIAWYVDTLARASDRVSVVEYARTHEARPCLLVAITSSENQARLESIRVEHVAAVKAGREPSAERPLVVWLGYSVHGDEPSGANAAPSVMWHLASSLDPEVTELLDHTVVLVDPMINPDGLNRFATWANMHQGKQPVADPVHREHRQAWPSGRTNHYWFDLNRDWLLQVHPESRGRLDQFHRWRPNVLTDHHEMGTGSTFFFQPGVPSRQNPVTPERNLDLTRAIARYHAEALDGLGELFYSEEDFDDYYYGKGSSYPDALGSIGILFEQASSRGHLQENAWGELSFRRTIRNQVTVSLSTLKAAGELRDELLAFQAESTRTARDEAADSDVAGWVFGDARDPARTAAMVDLLLAHDIVVHELTADVTLEGRGFEAGAAFLVPHDQPHGRLARALFERRTEFADATFYDVSTWTLPLSYGVPDAVVSRAGLAPDALGPALRATPAVPGGLRGADAEHVVAYALPWRGLHAPRALARLHAEGVRAQVATRPFSSGGVGFEPGTLIVPVGRQDHDRAALEALVADVVASNGLQAHRLASGLTPEGIDLGSPAARPLTAPRVAVVVDGGASSYEAGEVWHHLDVRVGMPVVLVESDSLTSLDLHEVTHVVLVNGAGDGLGASATSTLKDWVRGGGVVVATRSSATWAGRALLDLEDATDPPPAPGKEPATAEAGDDPAPLAYIDFEAERARSLVSGTLFAARVDATHPLGFGLGPEPVALFRRDTRTLARSDDPVADALVYLDEPLLSGYADDENVETVSGSVAAHARRLGRGTVVRLADDPVFRGHMRGSARLLENAIFFGDTVKSTGPLRGDD